MSGRRLDGASGRLSRSGGAVEEFARIVRAWATSLTWDRALVAVVLIWGAVAYAEAYSRHFAVVGDPEFPLWWIWTDQARYYRAAQAWAEGSLDPAKHWYFAGYPLIGALFIHWSPGAPFYVADLVCLVAFGALLTALAARLAGDRVIGRVAGAGAFLVTVVLSKYDLKAFVEPWSTTPIAPLSIGALLLTLRLWDRPSAWRGLAAGACTASVFLFRPTDTLPLALAVGLASAVALPSLPWRAMLRVAMGGLGGAAIPLAITGATYVAVFGLHQSKYLEQSALTGFEWRLVALHWVTLFVSPLPEFREEYSLAQTFFWIIPGVAGMVACLLALPGRARLRHGLVISAVALHVLLYLSYRDLHPQGLFRFGNYHYFKWCLPIFGLYAVFLATETWRQPRRLWAIGVGVGVAAALFSWRLEWRAEAAPWLASARLLDRHTLLLPHAPTSPLDGIFVPASGGFADVYLASHVMFDGPHFYMANADFKAFPVEGGFILMGLRPLPADTTLVRFVDTVTLNPGALRLLHAHLFVRIPDVVGVATIYFARWMDKPWS